MKPASVLVTDDSLVVRTVVLGELEEAGYEVAEAVDGAAAIERCRLAPPDVVLLDIEMPGLDGYQVLAELKGDPRLCDIPVVFLTSRSDMADVVAGLRSGAHDYLRKPFESPELIARVAAAVRVKRLQDELRERNGELDRMSRTDTLTGLFNRRHLDDAIRRSHAEAERHGQPMALLLLDVDHFKAVNDTYGHPAGDDVLRAFGQCIEAGLRAGDVAGRWGGEEFLVLFPQTSVEGALVVAERIRAAVAASPMPGPGAGIQLTVSGGCAAGPAESVDVLLAEVDACLYEAKHAGRNRIVTPAGA